MISLISVIHTLSYKIGFLNPYRALRKCEDHMVSTFFQVFGVKFRF